ncbi:MAG: single-stranded-DNA-specific exonuclease RecJ, partial [Gammaproteobacteria bacterium]
ARNIDSADELDYSLARLCSYQSLGNVETAASLLADLIEQKKYILVVSDYDADGATACALAIRGLSAMGATNVAYLVPDRFKQGYGLSQAVVEQALDLNPDAIITVDNGISSIEGIALARANNIDVIVTDHHLPGKQIPAASVIVNPNLAGDGFPSKCIAGVGVMFYVLAALRAELRKRDWFGQHNLEEPNLAGFMDLVALGTVADVVPLDYNNRIMVSHGLSLIRSGRCVPGIRALFDVAGKDLKTVVATDMGFVAGPRLNAAGRLTDMSLGIECLISNDEDACYQMAGQLDGLNRQRKEIQDEMHQQALREVSQVGIAGGQELPAGLCLFKPDWHQGVIGILASKLKDRLQRPVIAFAKDDEGVFKGSARSISGIHIRDVIDRIATEQPDLIVTFGGHAMAAGLTLFAHAYDEFSRLFNDEITRQMRENGISADIYSDGELHSGDINMEVAELIRSAGPWGQGFPEPVFDGVFEIIDKKIVGENHLKLKVKSPDSNLALDAIAFNTTNRSWPKGTTGINAVYRLDINEFMGRRTTQLIVEYLEPLVD